MSAITSGDVAKVEVLQWVDPDSLAIMRQTTWPKDQAGVGPWSPSEKDWDTVNSTPNKVKSFEEMMIEVRQLRPAHDLGTRHD